MSILTLAPPDGGVESFRRAGVRKVLLLDFDGVINPSGRNTFSSAYYNPSMREAHPNPHFRERDSYASWRAGKGKDPKSFEIAWSPELVSDLNRVLSDPSILLVWVSTWRENMFAVSVRLGIESARQAVFLPWGDIVGDDHAKKTPAVADFLRNAWPELKVAWVDDDVLAPSNRPDDVIASLPVDVLTIAPVSLYGLSRAEVSKIEAFFTD